MWRLTVLTVPISVSPAQDHKATTKSVFSTRRSQKVDETKRIKQVLNQVHILRVGITTDMLQAHYAMKPV